MEESGDLLCEVSWEVCGQMGGIYTVIRTKAAHAVGLWGERYCLVGPYDPQRSPAEFEEAPPQGPFGRAVSLLREAGLEVHYGYWLIVGRPIVVLFNVASMAHRLDDIKYRIWEHHGISLIANDRLVDAVAAFGGMVTDFLRALAREAGPERRVIGHFHEWMGATAIPELRREKVPVATVFTTHATYLGRYLAMNDAEYYDHLRGVDWRAESRRHSIEVQVQFERLAARDADVMTTVSHVTGQECEHLLDRKPDVLLPNGLNVDRFVALHEFQNLHLQFKEKIHEFVMGHFFPCYTFDLDKTLYGFSSGRFEYTNKGFDLAIEAMARLNERMKREQSDQTVVFFLITRMPYRSIASEVLRSRAVLEEMRQDCKAIEQGIGNRLFLASAAGQWPRLDDLVDDYWRFRLRRTRHAWRSDRLPPVVTHDLMSGENDAILNQLRGRGLANRPEDPVKIVYHPDFITPSNPLFGMDYDQFVRGCHLGIFPSLYEPWGYAPLECAVLGTPAITSDLAGFGCYLQEHVENHHERGMMVLPRRHVSYDAAASRLTDWVFEFTRLTRRERIDLRNRVESSSVMFDWQNLGRYYQQAYELALERSNLTLESGLPVQ